METTMAFLGKPTFAKRMGTERAERLAQADAIWAWWQQVVDLLGDGWTPTRLFDREGNPYERFVGGAQGPAGVVLHASYDTRTKRVAVRPEWPSPQGPAQGHSYMPRNRDGMESSHAPGAKPQFAATLIRKWLPAYVTAHAEQAKFIREDGSADITRDAAASLLAQACEGTVRAYGPIQHGEEVPLHFETAEILKVGVTAYRGEPARVSIDLRDLSVDQAEAVLMLVRAMCSK